MMEISAEKYATLLEFGFKDEHIQKALYFLTEKHDVDDLLDTLYLIYNDQITVEERVHIRKLELQQKISAISCNLCKKYDADILLLPCAHLCCCILCLSDVFNCPKCHKKVLATKQVFFC